MANLLTNIGEEYVAENDISGATVKATVYNDATDSLSDTSTLSDITTEPTGSSYARQSTTVTTKQIGGDFGFDSDAKLTFDVSDSSATVDHGALIVSFQSDTVAGDSSATDHLIAVDALTQSRDLSQIDDLVFSAGELGFTLD